MNDSNIVEVPGDLFEAVEAFALEHRVSKDFKMSHGIEFKRRFGQVDGLVQQYKTVTEIVQ